MSRTKLVLLSLMAVLVVSVAGSASASAAGHAFWVCKNVTEGTGKYNSSLCQEEGPKNNWEYKTIGAAEEIAVEGTSASSQLESEVANAQITIECSKDVFKGKLLAEGKSTGEITFSGCNVYQLNKTKHRELLGTCEVPNIIFKFRDQLIDGPGHGPQEEFKPEGAASTLFVEFEIKVCTLKGKYKAEVTAAEKGVFCALHEPFRSEVVHEIICTSEGDENLRFNGKRASFFSTDLVQLVGGAQWFSE